VDDNASEESIGPGEEELGKEGLETSPMDLEPNDSTKKDDSMMELGEEKLPTSAKPQSKPNGKRKRNDDDVADSNDTDEAPSKKAKASGESGAVEHMDSADSDNKAVPLNDTVNEANITKEIKDDQGENAKLTESSPAKPKASKKPSNAKKASKKSDDDDGSDFKGEEPSSDSFSGAGSHSGKDNEEDSDAKAKKGKKKIKKTKNEKPKAVGKTAAKSAAKVTTSPASTKTAPSKPDGSATGVVPAGAPTAFGRLPTILKKNGTSSTGLGKQIQLPTFSRPNLGANNGGKK